MPDLKYGLSKKIVDEGRLSRSTIEWWVKRDEQQGVEKIFWNFVHYLRDNPWHYDAGSNSDKDLVRGTGNGSVNCGALKGAFILTVMDVFEYFEVKRVMKFEDANINQFITKKGLTCFDSTVKGNVRRKANSYSEENRCYFGEHFFCKYGNRFYDPTFCKIYKSEKECLEWPVEKADSKYARLRTYKFADNGKIVLAVLSADRPTGFGQGYLLTDGTHFAQHKRVRTEYKECFGIA